MQGRSQDWSEGDFQSCKSTWGGGALYIQFPCYYVIAGGGGGGVRATTKHPKHATGMDLSGLHDTNVFGKK